jgi:hypothetical protein
MIATRTFHQKGMMIKEKVTMQKMIKEENDDSEDDKEVEDVR